jgi:nitrate reductase / nitrite oxidoreductase, beta subunit
MRIPIRYLANILAAGNTAPVELALKRLAAMRAFKRRQQLTGEDNWTLARDVGLQVEDLERMFRLLAIASRTDRYVIPKARRETGGSLQTQFFGPKRSGERT